jgi:hypothetical protein
MPASDRLLDEPTVIVEPEDIQARGCSPDMLLFRNADEIAQMAQRHLIPSRY